MAVAIRRSHDEELAIVRSRMQSGLLPAGPVAALFGGRGTGAICSGCTRTIDNDVVEFEIQLSSGRPESLPLMMHSHCLRLWFDEWDN